MTTKLSLNSRGSRRSGAGFSLLELLVVLGVLGILLALGAALLRPPSSRLFANDVTAAVRQARFEAIKRDEAVAVVWNPTLKQFETRVNTGGALSCASADTTLLASRPAATYRNLSVSTDLGGSGFLWFPNGSTKACNGTSSASTTTITDTRTTVQVKLSSTGKVSLK